MKTKSIENVDVHRVTVLYQVSKQNLMYLVDGKPVYGFVGHYAERKFYEALDKGYNVVIKSEIMDTQAKIRQFHAILAKKGLLDLKHDIIAEYGVKSSKDLTEMQLDELINKLQTVSVTQELRDARSKVLNLLNKLGITGSKQDGWEKVNNYLLQPRISGKKLYEMTSKELNDTSLRLRSIIYKQKDMNYGIN